MIRAQRGRRLSPWTCTVAVHLLRAVYRPRAARSDALIIKNTDSGRSLFVSRFTFHHPAIRPRKRSAINSYRRAGEQTRTTRGRVSLTQKNRNSTKIRSGTKLVRRGRGVGVGGGREPKSSPSFFRDATFGIPGDYSPRSKPSPRIKGIVRKHERRWTRPVPAGEQVSTLGPYKFVRSACQDCLEGVSQCDAAMPVRKGTAPSSQYDLLRAALANGEKKGDDRHEGGPCGGGNAPRRALPRFVRIGRGSKRAAAIVRGFITQPDFCTRLKRDTCTLSLFPSFSLGGKRMIIRNATDELSPVQTVAIKAR